MELTKEVWRKLRRPFPEGAVKWKAQTTNKDKTRALAVAFVDARNVMERLDRAIGPGGWHDAYEVISIDAGGYVVQCSLTVLGVTKADVGDSSASGGGGNLAKTAYSDALKRAAVKFGVGRYLYALPLRWVAYDAQHKRLAEVPELPTWARPAQGHPSATVRTPGFRFGPNRSLCHLSPHPFSTTRLQESLFWYRFHFPSYNRTHHPVLWYGASRSPGISLLPNSIRGCRYILTPRVR